MNTITSLSGTSIAAYIAIFLGAWLSLSLFPPLGELLWPPLFLNLATSLLFTLLVGLTARLANTDHTLLGLAYTALFLVFFCPGAELFFLRDEEGLLALGSQCVVPFFISQYMRVSRKDFRRWYFLMLVMGIFCSYTHNGITIPLCATFVWLSFLHRRQFFRQACWPMVVGFVIGTGLSLWHRWQGQEEPSPNLTTVTSTALSTLWDTKVFLLALGLTAYILTLKNGRRTLLYIARRHYVLACCLVMSLLTLPFAPLGIENAVTGVCFFGMLWALFLSQSLILKYFNKRI